MIAIGCDHAGFDAKKQVMQYLDSKNIQYKDFGCYDTNSCDYPIIGAAVANAVANKQADKGVIICGTGIGISISANKIDGIRCALCGDVFSAKATRMHNDANMLALGARVVGVGLMLEIVEAFLSTDYEGGRHQRRIDLITEIEKNRN